MQTENSSPIQPPIIESTVLLVNPSPGALLIKAHTQSRIIAGSYTPWFDSNQLIYFQTPQMVDGTHTVNVTVRIANATNPFILDSIRVAVAVDGGILNSLGVPSSPTPTSSALPVSSTNSAPVGTIVGGTVGGISGLVILTTIVWYFLRRWSLGRRVARFLGVRGPRDIQDTVEGLYTFR